MSAQTSITNALVKNVDVTELDIELIQHGLEVFLSDTFNILSVLLFSVFLHNTYCAVLYLIILSTLRVHTGGWHARTKIACYCTYQLMFLVFSTLIKHTFSPGISHMILCSSLYYMWVNAPVEHIYNPLSNDVKAKNRTISHRYLVLYTLLYFFVSNEYSIYKTTIMLSFLYNGILMYAQSVSAKKEKP